MAQKNSMILQKRHAFWMDHEILRALYHNQSKVAPGVYRSNQPSPNRIKPGPKRNKNNYQFKRS